MTHTLHPLAEEYLERLDRAAAHLPRVRRRDLVDEIEAHLVEALGPEPTEADVRNALDRLGSPEEIVDAETPPTVTLTARRNRMGAQEWLAVMLLPLGGFLLGVGWIAGVILLWTSRAWSTLDKVIGTVVIPGGLATVASLSVRYLMREVDGPCPPAGSGPVCEDGGVDLGFLALAVLAVVSIVTAIYLAKRADLNRRDPTAPAHPVG